MADRVVRDYTPVSRLQWSDRRDIRPSGLSLVIILPLADEVS
jgi:hypothetical protein